jgi:hypothetical protein
VSLLVTSSAHPDHLDAYVRAAQSLNDTLRRRSGSLEELYKTVVPRLGWGAFDASATLGDFARYINSNHRTDQWVATVSETFRQADSGGGTATVANASIEAALAAAGLRQGPPTGKSCAETLACTIDDFNSMSIDERRAFVAEFQRLYGARFYSEGKWNNIDGVLQFFSDDNLGRPGTWESWVDSSILHGFERGAAIALGRPVGDQGNPGADRWFLYFNTMELTRGGISKAEQDRLWSEGEQASTGHGYEVAARRGTSPGLPELSFAAGGEVYRWILRHEGQIDTALETAGRTKPFLWPVTQLGREALHDFTAPANRYPSYLGGHIMHGGGQILEGGGEVVGGLVLRDPRMLGEGVIDAAQGGAEVVRHGGEAVVRSGGWLWDHTFGR